MTISPDEITIITVSIAGLIDGINPCVFSTLIFFISILLVSKVTGRKLLFTGISYCLACFITYFALGLGLLHFLKFISDSSTIKLFINWTMVAVLLYFALLSFKDAWLYGETQNPNSIKLKLPDVLKRKINNIIKRGLSYKYLIPGAFFIGIFVTLIESICTGQVYLPTLVLLVKENVFEKWIFYLILYNIAFIMPLNSFWEKNFWINGFWIIALTNTIQ